MRGTSQSCEEEGVALLGVSIYGRGRKLDSRVKGCRRPTTFSLAGRHRGHSKWVRKKVTEFHPGTPCCRQESKGSVVTMYARGPNREHCQMQGPGIAWRTMIPECD